MTDTDFTPAPWGYDGRFIYSDNRVNERPICRMDNDSEEDQANAQLIAAAPELLEALREANSLIVSLTSKNEMPVAPEYIEKVRKQSILAAAKARGQK